MVERMSSMIIGIVKERKVSENRVALTPSGAQALIKAGHKVYIEKDAGRGSGFADFLYEEVGAQVLDQASKVWQSAEMLMKVKEPLPEEYKYLRKDLILFTFLHLANDYELTKALMESSTIAIGYETVQLENKSLPLLSPMSEIAGKMAVQEGLIYLENIRGGKGILVDGVPGVPPAHILVLGGGVAGTGAIKRAVGIGARVTVLDIDIERLRYLSEIFPGKIETLYSNEYNLKEVIPTADLVIGSVLIPGAKTSKLVSEEMVKLMEPGSVIVDISIDQGGCVATIEKATTHEDPVFIKHGVIHYAVSNIPGAVARTSTLALTNSTLTYAMRIANLGWKEAMKKDPALAKGANVLDGKIVYEPVAKAHELDYTPLEEII